ncbi:ion transporter [Candidatus Woesearchaeota archaeon]|nr:ion transporter [Candidatus Woesearchaeota archaeon]
MKRWMHKIEVIVDKAIPPCLLVLLVIIILDLGFPEMVEHYHLHQYIVVADYIIIGIFVLDLIFKWQRTRHIPLFLKKYWLDILAVFPFFLVFRLFEVAAGAFSFVVSESTQTFQAVLHEGLEVEKEGARLLREAERFTKEGGRVAREAEKLSKLSRSSRFMRFLRPIMRIPRFFKAVPKTMKFYEKPHGEHHEHEYMPKHAKKK